MSTTDWIGFIGVFQLLLAYVLNVAGKISKHQLLYILLNLSGAAVACLASIMMHYMPFIILEAAWTLVSFFSLINYMKWQEKQI
jgi:hypothetical protein